MHDETSAPDEPAPREPDDETRTLKRVRVVASVIGQCVTWFVKILDALGRYNR